MSIAPDFAFLTNHGKTLLVIAHDPRIRIRDIAALLGITERATQLIVSDLAHEGYLVKERVGRRNRYTLAAGLPLRHAAESGHSVDELVKIFSS